MDHGEIAVVFDGEEEEDAVVLPRYAFIAGRRIPVCIRPGTFLHQTLSYRSFADYYDFMDRKYERKYNPRSQERPREANVYGVGKQARRKRKQDRQRSRSQTFSRVRLDFLVSYHVCLWMETHNKKPLDAVQHFRNLPLKKSTVENWKTRGGSKYYKELIEKYGNRKSSNRGMI